MGLIDLIFGKRKFVQDEFFGKMLFDEWKKEPSKNNFECQRHFAPSNKNIELGIDADLPGPSQAQKDFFLKIERHYSELAASMKPMVEDKLRNWKSDFVINDFRGALDPVYIALPRVDQQPVAWLIGLELIEDRNIHITVRFLDLEPSEIEIDT